MQQIIFFVGVLGLFVGTLGQPADKLEATFVGESGVCNGVSAQVIAKDDFVQVDGQAIVEVVAQSFANALKSPDGAIAEARSIGRKVLTVIATAEATLDVVVNSPSQGCWAIAYGTAEATAIASAMVEAFAKGISAALGSDVSSSDFAQAKTKEDSVSKAISTVALLLYSGDGSGKQQRSAVAFAQAKAVAINCAFAEAFAEVYKDDTTVTQAIVRAGCPSKPESVPTNPACACQKQGATSSGVPGDCGSWGGADQICYVLDPKNCACAQDSTTYPGQKWSFCGPTLNTMKQWLTFQTDKVVQEYGFCP